MKHAIGMLCNESAPWKNPWNFGQELGQEHPRTLNINREPVTRTQTGDQVLLCLKYIVGFGIFPLIAMAGA